MVDGTGRIFFNALPSLDDGSVRPVHHFPMDSIGFSIRRPLPYPLPWRKAPCHQYRKQGDASHDVGSLFSKAGWRKHVAGVFGVETNPCGTLLTSTHARTDWRSPSRLRVGGQPLPSAATRPC